MFDKNSVVHTPPFLLPAEALFRTAALPIDTLFDYRKNHPR